MLFNFKDVSSPMSIGVLYFFLSGGLEASPVDFSRYIAPSVDGVSRLESQRLSDNGLALFIDYEWGAGGLLTVTSYLYGGGVRYEEREYGLRFERGAIIRTEEMSNISESFSGVSATSTQAIPKYLEGGELIVNYGRYNKDVGVVTFEAGNGETYGECITLNLDELSSDNVLVSTYCKGVGLVGQYETNDELGGVSIQEFSLDEVAGLDSMWAEQCQMVLERWVGATFSSIEEE